MNFDQKRLLALIGTVLLAGVVVVAGIWGPSVWKAMRQQPDENGQVVLQTPSVDQNGGAAGAQTPDGTSPNSGNGSEGTTGNGTGTDDSGGKANPTSGTATTQPDTGTKKYKEPDVTLIDLAPSIAEYFGNGGLSDNAKNVAFGAVWNIDQYVDGYLYGITAGPQMNEEDIKKYIVFHKTLWDKQVKAETGAQKAVTFVDYMSNMLNRGIDAFDAKDKARIEQFHQEIHDMNTHLFRNDLTSKIYGSTPFATKR